MHKHHQKLTSRPKCGKERLCGTELYLNCSNMLLYGTLLKWGTNIPGSVAAIWVVPHLSCAPYKVSVAKIEMRMSLCFHKHS